MCFVVLLLLLLLLLLYQLPDDSSDDSEAQLWGDADGRRPKKPPVSSESEPMEEDVPETPHTRTSTSIIPYCIRSTYCVREVSSEEEEVACGRYFQDCGPRAADCSL